QAVDGYPCGQWMIGLRQPACEDEAVWVSGGQRREDCGNGWENASALALGNAPPPDEGITWFFQFLHHHHPSDCRVKLLLSLLQRVVLLGEETGSRLGGARAHAGSVPVDRAPELVEGQSVHARTFRQADFAGSDLQSRPLTGFGQLALINPA